MLVVSKMGTAPWDVLHQGLASRFNIELGLVMNIVGLLVLPLVMAFKKQPSFGVAKLAMFLCLFGSPIFGWAIMYFGLKALGRAQDQAQSIAYNAERAKHLGETAGLTL